MLIFQVKGLVISKPFFYICSAHIKQWWYVHSVGHRLIAHFRNCEMGIFYAPGLCVAVLISASSVPSLLSIAFFPYTVQLSGENDIIFYILDVIILFYVIARLIRVSAQIDNISAEDIKDYATGYTNCISRK